VLLDYSLPGRNGVEILKRIRSTHPFVPVVMLTGLGNETVAVAAMQAGAQNYLAKSTITPQALEHLIQGAIQYCAMQSRIVEQHETLGVFARALAHDLKEPIRTLQSMLDVLRQEATFPGETLGYFQSIQNCAGRMAVLIDTVRAYTKLDSVRRAVCDECDVNDLVEAAMDNIRALIREREAVITLSHLPRILVNRTHVTQILQNLLSNAIRHCECPPRITVSAVETPRFWKLCVSDNGPGVNEEEFKKLFKPFTRFSRLDTDGLGLGLAICKKLMDLHRGRIWCESPAGAGATFVLSFPKSVAVEPEARFSDAWADSASSAA
jgi:signal transduction histidine kinase